MINKIDLPSAEPERVRQEIEESSASMLRMRFWPAPKRASASKKFSKAIDPYFPPPKGDADAPLHALIIDCWFDPYHGAVVMMRVIDGQVARGTQDSHDVERPELRSTAPGVYSPGPTEITGLSAGEVGFIMAGIKEVCRNAHRRYHYRRRSAAGESAARFQTDEADGFQRALSDRADQYQALRDALDKLRLNDSSFTFEPETSQALGFGFRCGFLGLLHMDIIRERLEREFQLKPDHHRGDGYLPSDQGDW